MIFFRLVRFHLLAKLGNSEKNLEDVRALPMREMGGGPKYFLLGTYIVGWSDTALYCDFRKRPLLVYMCCQSGLFLKVQFKKISEFAQECDRARPTLGKVFIKKNQGP